MRTSTCQRVCPVFHWKIWLQCWNSVSVLTPRSALLPSFLSKFSPRSVGRTAYLAPPLVDNSRTSTLSSSSSTSCRPDTQAAITTMIQINPWVCLCCATLARERTGAAAAQGQNSGTGLLEVCVGGGRSDRGSGQTGWNTFKLWTSERENELNVHVKASIEGTEGEIIPPHLWSYDAEAMGCNTWWVGPLPGNASSGALLVI